MYRAEFRDLKGNLIAMSEEKLKKDAQAFIEKWEGAKNRLTKETEYKEKLVPKWLKLKDAKSNRVEIDEFGEKVTYYTFAPTATTRIINLKESEEWINSQAIAKRRQEYPSVEEVINVIFDHGINSNEFNALKSKRRNIKEKYPKFGEIKNNDDKKEKSKNSK